MFIDDQEPTVQDAAKGRETSDWLGANPASFKLMRCLEAIRDLTVLLEDLVRRVHPVRERRRVKKLATPLYELACGVRDLFNELQSNANAYTGFANDDRLMTLCRQAAFNRRVPLQRGSSLRRIRDKIDAHIDKDAVMKPEEYWREVHLTGFLPTMQRCLREVLYLLTLDVFGWTRDSKRRDRFTLMAVDGSVVDLKMENDEPTRIVGVTLAKSPKSAIAKEATTLMRLIDEVASRCGGGE